MATCTLPDEYFEEFKALKKERSPKNTAMVFMIDKSKHEFKIEETFVDISLEKLQEELSNTSPRYIVYVYKHTHPDGRQSFPMVFIYFMPKGISPAVAMTYSANKEILVNKLEIMKSFNAETVETLTEPWLKEKLAFFK
ncbi:hypothetical protein DDB_G0282595 [Dictyostelium discoideum AX4]|uniref:ADF-H domain-containing protein n=1 Tax=Dictyostelium discoideum TaxID=44689 RepID=Q54S93_DICDI|nr:hypothetical protein DDB_G0282595 [Dictyostelium discoideum AX4]EAL66157.1 hypothetical protein DDB_G0282595 [Dictyostelium discoideum AX4]|eukprot:XP_640146.1 hypothetical protein DDB_G0282595 [Dictyostelium discoideum AX4]